MNHNPLKAKCKSEDFVKFRQGIISDFFEKEIRKSKTKWDFIIKIGRKGTFIFNDLSEGRPVTKNDISSFDLHLYNLKDFEQKNVLLFDDSIHSGDTIRSYMRKFPHSNITIAVLIANKSILEQLKVRVICYSDPRSRDYDKLYYRYMPQYFDYICLPQPTLLSEEYSFSRRLENDEIKDLFTVEGTRPEEFITYEPAIKYEDRFKMELHFDESRTKKLISKAFPKFSNIITSECKVRLYIHKYKTKTTVYVEYRIVVENTLPKCDKSLENCYNHCLIENENGCPICFNFDFANLIRNQIEGNLKSKSVSFKISPLDWYFNGQKLDVKYE